MKIKLHHCENLGDWYTIIRTEHDGRKWMERTSPNSQRLMMSERLSPEASIEGNGAEMLELAHAIKRRGMARFKRCSVHFESDGAHFSSPRNSERDVVVPVECADEFAAQVLAELTPNAPGDPYGTM